MRKKWGIVLIIAIISMLAIFAGCKNDAVKTAGDSDVTGNESCEQEIMKTVNGKEISGTDEHLTLFPMVGAGFVAPDEWMGNICIFPLATEESFYIVLQPEEKMTALENMTEEEMSSLDFEEYFSHGVDFLKVFYVEDEKNDAAVKKESEGYAECDRIGKYQGRTYYMAYNKDIRKLKEGDTSFSEADLKSFDEIASYIDEIKENIVLFTPEKEEEAFEADAFKSFEAKDMNGKKVTQNIFADYDLTMVNIWATWCGPCVSEIPDLADLAENLPQNVNMITICTDADENRELAEEILTEAKAGFMTIAGDENLKNTLLKDVVSYPTTVFIDKNGNFVGNSLLGAYSAEEYKKEITARTENI